MPNIYDISERSGVSIATVSRVLNGSPKVSEATKNKVLAVMDELGYTPNVFARGLGLNTMNTVGIMCSDSSDPFLANAVYYLEQNLRKHGYDSFLCCTGYELQNKKNYLELILTKRVDGLILVGSSLLEPNDEDNLYIKEAASHVPVMLMNGILKGAGIYSVVCDDCGAVSSVTERLIKSGRKRILYLYTAESGSGLQKLKGYKEALKTNGIKCDKDLIRLLPCDIENTRHLLSGLYTSGLRFDAVVCSEDRLAVGAIKAAKDMGLSIPGDLQVVGYNNSLLALCTDPELTSIDNHVETLSATAVKCLTDVFQGKRIPAKTIIQNALVQRETTRFQ